MNATTERVVERAHPPRWLISHLVNPVARQVLRGNRKVGNEVLLLRFIGRRSGRSYEIPVGYRHIGGKLALLTNSGWRHNFRGGASVEVVLKGEVVQMRAELMDDPVDVAHVYRDLIDEVGLEDAYRRLGIKILVDRTPTVDELSDMARRSGLSVIWLEPAA